MYAKQMKEGQNQPKLEFKIEPGFGQHEVKADVKADVKAEVKADVKEQEKKCAPDDELHIRDITQEYVRDLLEYFYTGQYKFLVFFNFDNLL